MNDNDYEETFLAEWITGELSDDALKTMLSKEDYCAMILIRSTLNSMVSPQPDLDMHYEQLQNKISKRTRYSNLRRLTPRILGMAASILLLMMLGFYHTGLVGEKEYSSKLTLQMVQLNSAVHVTLSPHTKLRQRAPLYNSKLVYLEKGKAYFEVVKGNAFSIETKYGIVKVLGTKFTVKADENLFEVHCFEGKVRIDYQGRFFNVDSGTFFNNKIHRVIQMDSSQSLKPEWINEYKKFTQSDLSVVLAFIAKNYNIHVDYDKSISNNKFTGSIPKYNLQDALDVICYPFNLSSELHDDSAIIKK